jgi:hypothetical protein
LVKASWGISAIILGALFLYSCSGSSNLLGADRLKLDPPLVRLLNAERIVEADYDMGLRPDGTKEYAVIIRSKNVEDLRSAGIQIASNFGDVITARVTIAEIRHIMKLNSVRAITIGSKNYPQ